MLSQINVGVLWVFDNILTIILYGRVSASKRRVARITLHVPSLPCKPTHDDVLWTVTTFLTWVSHVVFTICDSVSHTIYTALKIQAGGESLYFHDLLNHGGSQIYSSIIYIYTEQIICKGSRKTNHMEG